jgi:hypothetical protein
VAGMTKGASTTEAGWLADPLDAGRWRWWDGRAWTAFVCDISPGGSADRSIHWVADLPATLAPSPVAAPEPESDAGTAADRGVAVEAPPLHFAVIAEPVESWDPPVEPRVKAKVLWPTFAPTATAASAAPAAEAPALEQAPESTAAPTVSSLADAIAPISGFDPIVAAFGDEARPPKPAPPARHRSRRPLVAIAAAVAALVAAGAAVAGAGLLPTGSDRPTVASVRSYRDQQAGFSLGYPDDWRVLRRDPDGGIRFAIGAPGAPSSDTNTVSVVVGKTSADLPQLHTLADQLTEALRAKLPGVRLDEAGRTRLAGAPGFRFTFQDPDATPSTHIEQLVGRTTAGRPLTVTITIREPRTAPTARQLRDFLGSLQPS